MLVPRRPLAIWLPALLTAFGVAGTGFLAPGLAAPKESGEAVHVYPGAEPLPASPSPAAGDKTNSGNPTGNPASGQFQPGESESHDGPGMADTPDTGGNQPQDPPDSASGTEASQSQAPGTAPPMSADEDEQAQAAQIQMQAAQHYELGTRYFGKWDLDLAEVELDEAVSIYPEFRIAHRDLCLISAAKFDLSRSLAEFMMVTGLTDPVPYSEADKVLLNNKAMHAHYKKGLAFGRNNKWTDAITELMWAQAYAPSDPSVHHSLAFAYASAGDFSNAEREYKTTFSASPQDGFAHADFANLLADRGQPGKAEDEMRKAVELSPNAAALHVDLGWLAESRKDLPTAENEFKAAVKLSPQHPGLWTHLGRIMENQGETEQAQSAYQQALKLDGQNDEARASLDRLNKQKPSA